MGQIKKKKAVSGFIQPRWPKERIVRWLEIGAIPAVVGLWFPDWVGTYFGEDAFAISPSLPYLPPFLTFIGALILLKACYEGILHMGYHFKGLIVSGVIAVAAAAASVAFWLAGVSVASLVMAASDSALTIASAAPWPKFGDMACAASPISTLSAPLCQAPPPT